MLQKFVYYLDYILSWLIVKLLSLFEDKGKKFVLPPFFAIEKSINSLILVKFQTFKIPSKFE